MLQTTNQIIKYHQIYLLIFHKLKGIRSWIKVAWPWPCFCVFTDAPSTISRSLHNNWRLCWLAKTGCGHNYNCGACKHVLSITHYFKLLRWCWINWSVTWSTCDLINGWPDHHTDTGPQVVLEAQRAQPIRSAQWSWTGREDGKLATTSA